MRAEMNRTRGVAERIPVEVPTGFGQTVMVVDDEPALVALAEEMLVKLGYKPVGFKSSVAALAAFRAAPQRFDAVLTDEPDLVIAKEIAMKGAMLDKTAAALGRLRGLAPSGRHA